MRSCVGENIIQKGAESITKFTGKQYDLHGELF